MNARQILALALALSFLLPNIHAAADTGRLYLLPDFRDPAMADAAIAFIRCAFEKGGVLVEIVETKDAGLPRLELTESGGAIVAILQRVRGRPESLGTHSPAKLADGLCETVTEAIAKPAIVLSAAEASPSPPASSTAAPPRAARKPFLERAWPYLAAAGLALGGFVVARSLGGKRESPPRNESRGYIVH